MKTQFWLTFFFCFSAFAISEAKYSVFNVAKSKESRRSCPLKISEDSGRRQELSKNWESLPQAIFVAKEAHLIVDSLGFHYESLQNFLVPGTQPSVCGSAQKNIVQRFSILAPTLIDTTVEAKVGSSVWNFQILVEQKNIKAWNLLSKGSTRSFELAKIFKEQGFQEKYYRINNREYEIAATKEINGKTITLSIIFDSIDDLP